MDLEILARESVFLPRNSFESEGEQSSDQVHEASTPRLLPPNFRRLISPQKQPECPVSVLGGATEQIFLCHVLPFLTAKELCVLSHCSLFFSRIASSPCLWKSLLQHDFLSVWNEEDASSSPRDRPRPSTIRGGRLMLRFGDFERVVGGGGIRLESSPAIPSTTTPAHRSSLRSVVDYSLSAKSSYVEKLTNVNNVVTRKLQQRTQYTGNLQNDARVTRAERLLDLTLVRFLIPLPVITFFLFTLLLALRFDGYEISMWICVAPLMFFFLYLIICIVVSGYVYRLQFSSAIYRGLWYQIGGPLNILFSDILGESKLLCGIAIFALVLIILQFLLVAVKLATDQTPGAVLAHLPWGVVFIPCWCMFALYCFAPFLGCPPSWFIACAIFVWIPSLIILVCLVVKFTGQENGGSEARIPLSLIFMPLWLIEGFTLLSALGYLTDGLFRMYRGYLERVDEQVAVFVVVWLLLGPFVIFQAMISVRDDQQIHSPGGKAVALTAVHTVISLLIFMGFAMVALLLVAVYYETPGRDSRRERQQQFLGTTDLFPI